MNQSKIAERTRNSVGIHHKTEHNKHTIPKPQRLSGHFDKNINTQIPDSNDIGCSPLPSPDPL